MLKGKYLPFREGRLLFRAFLAVTLSLLGFRPWGRAARAAEKEVDLSTLTSAQWREDLRYLAAELPRRHKNAFHFTTRAQFERAVAGLDADIPSLPAHQIAVRLLQITASIGDAHTYVHLPRSFRRYPLVLYWFGSELRVIAATPEYLPALGARVVRIGETSVADLQAKVRSVESQDENEWFYLQNSPADMATPEVLHTLGLVTDIEHAVFTLEGERGQEFRLDVRSTPLEQLRDWRTLPAQLPLYRQRPAEHFWFTYLEDAKTVYVCFRGYDSVESQSRQLFAFIESHPTDRLVIDMRQNGGGDFNKGRSLIAGLKRRPDLNQRGRLFVITGRRTFSAAMVNSIDFRKETNAILVGEPAGEKPNGYQENDEMKLPNSHLVVSYSTRLYTFLDQDALALLPDQQIAPSWQAFREGRDPVMEWVLAYKPAG